MKGLVGAVFELPFVDDEPPSFLYGLIRRGVPVFGIRTLRSGYSLQRSFGPIETRDIDEEEERVEGYLAQGDFRNPPKGIVFKRLEAGRIVRPNPWIIKSSWGYLGEKLASGPMELALADALFLSSSLGEVRPRDNLEEAICTFFGPVCHNPASLSAPSVPPLAP